MKGVWLVANVDGGWIRPMEHEGDYGKDDVIINVTVEAGGTVVRTIGKSPYEREAEEEGISLKEAAQNMEIDLG